MSGSGLVPSKLSPEPKLHSSGQCLDFVSAVDRWVYFAESAEPFPAMLVEGSHAKAFAQHDEGDQ